MSIELLGLSLCSADATTTTIVATDSRATPDFCHSLETLNSPQLQMAHGQVPYAPRKGEHVTYRPKPLSEGFRRHSTDGTGIAPESTMAGEERRFHPYCRQYSEGTPPLCLSPFTCLQEEEKPQSRNQVSSSSPPTTHGEGEQSPWPLSGLAPQASMFMGTAENPQNYSSQGQGTYGSLEQFQFPEVFPSGEQIQCSNYFYDTYDRISSNASQAETTELLYPKPLYSYSNLIFMALKSSKTGSLPVSEIYSFMTEHFPYFKTAPDGWKNSVRHNLSLNKCFEKVENKSGHASRKGCLWALNPTKVEKMQEELQKWRRKDPVTIRKSMARPDELDHLLEDRSDKMKPSSSHLHRRQAYPPLRRQAYDTVSPPAPTRPREHSPQSHRQHLYSYSLPTASQGPPYLTHNPIAFSFQCPVTQQPGTILPSNTGALESPLPAQTPPSYRAALQATGGDSRSMQELLLEGDLSTDIDALNPSLTDLQLHGLWEELKEDSLAPETLMTTPISLSSSLSRSIFPRVENLQVCLADSSGSNSGQEDPRGMLDLHYSPTFPNIDNSMSSCQHDGDTCNPLV